MVLLWALKAVQIYINYNGFMSSRSISFYNFILMQELKTYEFTNHIIFYNEIRVTY
jgi:hypothetical protein